MYRSKTCGELRPQHIGETVTLAGWLYRSNDLGAILFMNLRDRYGITQLVFGNEINPDLYEQAKRLGREFVLQATGIVRERSSKNKNIDTGDIEVVVTKLEVLNAAKTPPFTIEDETDGGDDLRMKYRYLDLRRKPLLNNMLFRSKLAIETRKFLSDEGFMEVETPVLIKSTPEGARDFVVPSRMNKGQFYALPQSPQTFKQILMVAGFDKYFQLVKCFRDEDLRADRQPEFTQIDCEMSFVHQEDILVMFESLVRHLFKTTVNVELPAFPRMTFDEAARRFGSDKPDTRFAMEFVELNDLTKGKGFKLFDEAELVVGICAEGCASYSRKQLDELSDWLKRPQIGATGMVYMRVEADGSLKSSVDKFYSQDDLRAWATAFHAKAGDLILILCGETNKVRKQLGELRLEMGSRLGLRKPDDFKPLWVLDFPLLEWDETENRFFAMHHPFTSPKPADIDKMGATDLKTLESMRADAYDMVINGWEIGGGSIRIHDRDLQSRNFDLLGFTKEEAEAQFGFLLGAFEYGAPPHGGLALGFDRLCSIMQGASSIRDFIAFPKNNQGRDMMIDTPSAIDDKQLTELALQVKLPIA